ncbi:MAG: isoaspartyl peptidase/L-asparaginase [Elusimicrobiota bacterium]
MAHVRILTHGGSSSPAAHRDGTQRAAAAARRAVSAGRPLAEAVLSAMDVLEDDPRFNAGTGSSLRGDHKTIQMDASFMFWRPTTKPAPPQFGAVACIEAVRHPARVAFSLALKGGALLCGPGATQFARREGHARYDPTTEEARRRFAAFLRGSDTVGCVATDGLEFAAALSSGGLTGSPLGRIGDVPLPGCGLYAGPRGAAAFTGIGEEILRRGAALRAYDRLARGIPASTVLQEARELLGDVEFGCILLGPDTYAAGSNQDMAWSFVESTDEAAKR